MKLKTADMGALSELGSAEKLPLSRLNGLMSSFPKKEKIEMSVSEGCGRLQAHLKHANPDCVMTAGQVLFAPWNNLSQVFGASILVRPV